ncbi:protein POLLEN DEFECTIVE IN GUIDANCE 1-like [Apium graveolens]|uniref:protein POLLEN DEFECTIVE IN GUIDANCE 1-like n=1 Tax=Apium graveolens TaxID=4045 RepID=UPI003D7A9F96
MVRLRNLSFDVLATTTFEDNDTNTAISRSRSDPPALQTDFVLESPKRNRRKRKNKSLKKKIASDGLEETNGDYKTVVYEEMSVPEEKSIVSIEFRNLHGGELRQRSFSVREENENENENANANDNFSGDSKGVEGVDDHTRSRKLEREESLNWKQLMAQKDPNYFFSVEKSPLKFFIEEMNCGNSLRTTSTLANEEDRERVYDTIFHLPWRCELLISVGYFVCLDSFLSIVTVMPIRLVMVAWRSFNARRFTRPSAAELSDFGCFVALTCGIFLLQQTDISLIYHIIRGQGTIKLYVVYNVLEIFDKMCQSFGGDVLHTLFSSAEGLANCDQETGYWLGRFLSDEVLAVAASIVHSFVLLAEAITLSTCVVAHNNALLALLVSNNFAEIKGSVFKRFSRDNVQVMVYSDSVERFHISSFILFVFAQYTVEAEYPWFEKFLVNASMVYICEIMIDIIKHSFIAKFNDIKPIVFSEFLEDLYRQRLKLEEENGKKKLTFVPLAPACVIIRVLFPVYAAHLPQGPFLWRLFCIFFLAAITFMMLTTLKMMVGMGLQKHATWYLERCQKRKLHCD